MAKVTMIELEIPQGRVAYPVEQADGILRMKYNGGWRLPDDSEWSWSAERGFERKATEQPSMAVSGKAKVRNK